MTAFFIPGVLGNRQAVQKAYDGIRRQVEIDQGHPPTSRRILSLWARRKGVDCVTEVGARDPLHGGTVVAIFDMGRRQPFVVCWQLDDGKHERARETLGCNAYSVLEFDA